MKKYLFLSIISILLLGCSGSQTPKGTMFKPQEKASTMTQVEKEAAIAKKRQELSIVSIDSVLYSNQIKLTILPPKPEGDISLRASECIQMKALQMVTANGIGGLGGDPRHILAITMTQTGKEATSTIPQKMICSYDLTFYVANVATNEIYGSCVLPIQGVGNSFEEATINAARSNLNEKNVKEMLRNSCDKIIAWYNTHLDEFKKQVKACELKGNYEQAYLLVSSVPQGATECFKYAQNVQDDLLMKWNKQKGEENLIAMKNLIGQSGLKYNPEVYAYYSLLPVDSPQKKDADSLFSKYIESISEEERNAKEHDRYIEAEKIALEKLRVQQTLEASQSTMGQYSSLSNVHCVSDNSGNDNDFIKSAVTNVAVMAATSISTGNPVLDAVLPQVASFAVPKLFDYFSETSEYA